MYVCWYLAQVCALNTATVITADADLHLVEMGLMSAPLTLTAWSNLQLRKRQAAVQFSSGTTPAMHAIAESMLVQKWLAMLHQISGISEGYNLLGGRNRTGPDCEFDCFVRGSSWMMDACV